MTIRRRLTIDGTVQGVGFRPFVYRIAREERLAGSVRNTAGAVVIDVQGTAEQLRRFEDRLQAEVRPPARIDRLLHENLVPAPGMPDGSVPDGFVICASDDRGALVVALAPDAATCPDCLGELADPTDRRHRYPFVNCTRCGPRYTIASSLPYDRPNTTMAAFAMCPACASEYSDPADRRFHAQPIACPACGPRAWLRAPGRDERDAEHDQSGASTDGDPAAAIDRARELLEQGRIVAVKGLGGFHLAVNARDDQAVERLRRRKRRATKPLAVMVRDLQLARSCARLTAEAEALLCAPAAPIVLAPARRGHGLSPAVAPGLAELGLLLPYTPLHHLLLQGTLDALVMTSGNEPAEPITTDNRRALRELPADAFLLHDRQIEVACDDSVVRLAGPGRGSLFVRRARGYVPAPLAAGTLPARSTLGLGAELKATVTTLCRGQLLVGRHLGDLNNPAAEAAFWREIERMLRFGHVEPEAVAVDLHPDLFSTRVAERAFSGLPICRIQHHHAHLAAVAVEHGLGPDEQLLGIVLDGIGLGSDGTIWGGELLRGSYCATERVGHLRAIPQPGGDRAALEPLRMAVSLLVDAGLADQVESLLPAAPERGAPGHGLPASAALVEICAVRAVSPLSSSAGRLFDGVAALLGVAPARQRYEAEAAARLEALAADCDDGYPLPSGPAGVLDTRVLIRALLDDHRSPTAIRAARFHNGLADGLASLALGAAAGLPGPEQPTVVLGGGCLVNIRLLGRLIDRLEAGGARVLWPRALPPGDGALSAGQAACAACWLDSGGRAAIEVATAGVQRGRGKTDEN